MTDLQALTTDDVLEALRLWHGGETSRWPLAHLRLGLQLAAQQERHSSLAEDGPAAQNRALLSHGLERLRRTAPDGEALLRARFEHRQDVIAVANSLNVAESSLYYRQRQAISLLAEILQELEDDASLEWRERMLARLELPTYIELFGVDKPLATLRAALMAEDEHFVVSIDGLGGLGKTALASRLARDLIQTTRFEEIGWITAKHTHLSTRGRLQVESGRPALTFPMLVDRLTHQFDLPESANGTQLHKQQAVKAFLRHRACLVIIDNLETVSDYRLLLPELAKWQKPSKFLLTSRLRLIDQPHVYSYSLGELEESAALQLIRQEAQRIGFGELAVAEASELKQIYEVVGGNPLALKLIIGQSRFHSLPRVLGRLAETRTQEGGVGLFDYIYREIWDSLAYESKTTLLALVEAGESGFPLEHLLEIAGLPETAVERCLEELVLLSMVDLKGTLFERRYSLHRLTEVFLLRMLAE